ncbi:MAG: hypothetical protein WDA18_07445 [Candidatus Ratteibacteria bacterium]|jgi:phosphopantetheinyl transferase (holo-ACP synthase)
MTLIGFKLLALSDISSELFSPDQGLFSVQEQRLCKEQKYSARNFAARLAAKFACVDAFSPVMKISPGSVQITTLSIRPKVVLSDSRCSAWNIEVSLTHSSSYAAALCAVTKDDLFFCKTP